jgi:hypothetical protein
MSTAHKTDWLICNLARSTGLHVVAGDPCDAAALAKYLHWRARNATQSTMLLEPSHIGTLMDFINRKPLTERWHEELVIFIVPNPTWMACTVNDALVAADVGIFVHDGFAYTVKGGEPNARPIRLSDLPEYGRLHR